MKFFLKKSKSDAANGASSGDQSPTPETGTVEKTTNSGPKSTIFETAGSESTSEKVTNVVAEPYDNEIVALESGSTVVSETGEEGIHNGIDIKKIEIAEKSKLQKHKKQTKYLIRSLEDEDEETMKNTEINSLLYATGSESVDIYKQNSSSDLIGRLYYDDFDSDSTPTLSLSPIGSGEGGTIPSNEYILERIKFSNRINSPSVSDSLSPETLFILSPTGGRNSTHKLKRGITFDASTNYHHSSVTLKLKHPQYQFRRNNKTYLVGFSGDLTSYKAIEWLFDEMIIHGDTLIVFHVVDGKSHRSIDHDKAQLIMDQIERLNVRDRKISIVLELALGKPIQLLRQAVEEYDPQIVVIGSKHYDETNPDSHHRLGFTTKHSMSKYFLEYAQVHVIIVKSTYVHEDELVNAIDSDTYFIDWLKLIDVSGTYQKERKGLSRFLSPSSSKTEMSPSRQVHSAKDNYLRPSLSRDNLFQLELEFRGRELGQSPGGSRLSSRSASETRHKPTARPKSFGLFHH